MNPLLGVAQINVMGYDFHIGKQPNGRHHLNPLRPR